MVNQAVKKKSQIIKNIVHGMSSLAFLFLLIEFFDELNYGIENAATPAIRADLGISYVQVGLMLGLPGMINTLIEPVVLLLGDTRYRKHIMLGGGIAIILSLIAIGSTDSFLVLLLALVVGYPASGAFVSLSQATLMDLNPGREPQMMARWTVAGSLGNLIGPLLLAAGFSMGFGWRWIFFALAGFCLLLVILTWFSHIPLHPEIQNMHRSTDVLKKLALGLWESIRNPDLLRWLILLKLSDLLLDVLTGYLPLYFNNVTGMTLAQTSLMMSVLMAAGLLSNILLIPILERYPGRNLIRISAAVTGILYAVWLLVPGVWMKIVLIIVIKLLTLGWYEVLQGEAFASVPGRSGTVMATSSILGMLGGAISFFVGWVAAQAGLPAAMWILLLGPISLVLFVPKANGPAEKTSGKE